MTNEQAILLTAFAAANERHHDTFRERWYQLTGSACLDGRRFNAAGIGGKGKVKKKRKRDVQSIKVRREM